MARHWKRAAGSSLSVVALAAVVGAVIGAVVAFGAGEASSTAPTSGAVGRSSVHLVAPAHVAQRIRHATVLVEASTCRGTMWGTGVVLPGGRVLTNRHVVEGATGVRLVLDGGRVRGASDVRASLLDDTAVVYSSSLPRGVRPAIVEGAKSDTPVFVAGHPSGGPLRVTAGRTRGAGAGSSFGADVGTVWRTSVPVRPGHSGSGVFTESGRLIGLVFARDPHDGTGVVLPAYRLTATASYRSIRWARCDTWRPPAERT